MTEEKPLKTYRGNCHCGAFVYEVELPEIKAVSTCNCSICTKKGYLWVKPSEIKVVKGAEDALTGYTFGSNTFYHKVSPLYMQDATVRLTRLVLPNLRHPSHLPWGRHARSECEDPVDISCDPAADREQARSIQGFNPWEVEIGTYVVLVLRRDSHFANIEPQLRRQGPGIPLRAAQVRRPRADRRYRQRKDVPRQLPLRCHHTSTEERAPRQGLSGKSHGLHLQHLHPRKSSTRPPTARPD